MTERIRVARTHQETVEYQRNRRLLVKRLLVGGGVILAGAPVTVYTLDKIHESFGSDEGSATGLLKGKELLGGEIIDEEQLVKRYYEVLSTNRPMEIDATLLKSTLYHAMRFFGLEEEKARKRAQNVYIADDAEMKESVCQGGISCIEDSPKGLGAEFSDNAFTYNLWDTILIPIHEAYHLSVDRVLHRRFEEDYGFLGKFFRTGSRMGFGGRESGGTDPGLDLINYVYLNPKSGREEGINLAEEFLAESGKQRYFRRLMDKGLGSIPDARRYASSTAYSFFYQGLVDVLDTKGVGGYEGWQQFWQYQLDPQVTDRLHQRGERKNFYKNLGGVILSKNKNSSKFKLGEDDIVGVGVIAFADFAIYGATNHKILLETLTTSNKLTQDNLKAIARYLRTKIPALKFE